MSKFNIELSYKNIKILKHSLEQRIDRDKELYEAIKEVEPSHLTEQGIKNIKEHEEHLKCLDALIKEMEFTGYRHGKNMFGSKYE
jgi:hypothetical protein